MNDFIINVNSKSPGVTQDGFGTILVLSDKEDIDFTVIHDLSDVKIKDESTNKLLETIFNQKPRPRKVFLIGKVDGNLTEVLDEALDVTSDFFFIVSTKHDIALAEKVELLEKMYFTTVREVAEIKGDLTNTVAIYHEGDNEYPAEALAVIMSYKVGGKTAKFKKLIGVEPSTVTATEKLVLEKSNIGTYEVIKGIAQTTGAKVLAGEWVDVVLGSYFIKFLAEQRVVELATNVDKIPFNNSGIGMLAGTIGTVMSAGVNQVILDGYAIDYRRAENVTAEEKASRVYNYLTATGELQGAIHGGTININLVYDEVSE